MFGSVAGMAMSRTIIGVILTGVAFFAKAKGYEINVEGLTGEISDLVQNMVGTVGLLLSFWGRCRLGFKDKRIGFGGEGGRARIGSIFLSFGLLLVALAMVLLASCAPPSVTIQQSLNCGEFQRDKSETKQSSTTRTEQDASGASAQAGLNTGGGGSGIAAAAAEAIKAVK